MEPRTIPVGSALCDDGCCGTGTSPVLSGLRRSQLRRRVRLLVSVTIAYNVLEAVVAITAGAVAGSTALIGFGLDSVIEVSSATAVAWLFVGANTAARERVALRVIAVSFFALAGYVSVESVRAFFGSADVEPRRSGSCWRRSR